jgi:hypothetical protein
MTRKQRAVAQQPHRDQPYRVISVSIYEDDLALLDAEVAKRKGAPSGRADQATRSGVLRELVRCFLPTERPPTIKRVGQRSGE